MSLQGTFDVFSMPELLRMLASASKSGTLIVESVGLGGRLDLIGGALAGAESAELRGPIASENELHRRAVEVCFAMTRHPGGAFRFAAQDVGGPVASASAWSVPIEPVLGELELLVAEWADICSVIASTELRPIIATQLAVDEIVIQAREWSLLARLDGVTSIEGLCSPQSSLVATCRAVVELVRRGAVTLIEAPALGSAFDSDPAETSAADAAYFGPRVVPVAPYGPGVDAAESYADAAAMPPHGEGVEQSTDPNLSVSAGEIAAPEDLAMAEHSAPSNSDPRDRGAILRMFSGLREA